MAFKVPEKFRVKTGPLATSSSDGNNGLFIVTLKHGQKVKVIASDGLGWEHVSVSRQDRAPTWDEMCQVKALFWEESDCVIQYHPAKKDYVNVHNHCLHLWRTEGIPTPLTFMV
jgi:hypothetical protein